MKGLSTQALSAQNSTVTGGGGGRDGRAESPAGYDSEVGGVKRKQLNCIFSTCIEIVSAQRTPGNAKETQKGSLGKSERAKIPNIMFELFVTLLLKFPFGHYAAFLVFFFIYCRKRSHKVVSPYGSLRTGR